MKSFFSSDCLIKAFEVTYVERRISAYKMLSRNMNGRDHLGNLKVFESIILKLIFKLWQM
jgi:hypothetical protein